VINAAVEGPSDEGAARAIILASGHDVGAIHPVGGKTNLDRYIPKYYIAALSEPWVVFRDSDNECPVELRRRLDPGVGHDHRPFRLRIAHTMTEAWLMADRKGFASHFGVKVGAVLVDVEALSHGKEELLRLCAASRYKWVREDVVAEDGGAGPLYVKSLNDFAMRSWDVGAASAQSPSLLKAIERLAEIPQQRESEEVE